MKTERPRCERGPGKEKKMHPSHSAPQCSVQDRAAVVATVILAEISRHLQEHWTEYLRELRDRIAGILRDEFEDTARMTRDEIRLGE
jgi:hypothetical protein